MAGRVRGSHLICKMIGFNLAVEHRRYAEIPWDTTSKGSSSPSPSLPDATQNKSRSSLCQCTAGKRSIPSHSSHLSFRPFHLCPCLCHSCLWHPGWKKREVCQVYSVYTKTPDSSQAGENQVCNSAACLSLFAIFSLVAFVFLLHSRTAEKYRAPHAWSLLQHVHSTVQHVMKFDGPVRCLIHWAFVAHLDCKVPTFFWSKRW